MFHVLPTNIYLNELCFFTHLLCVAHDPEHDGDVDLYGNVVPGSASLNRHVENNVLFGYEVGYPKPPRHTHVKPCGPDSLAQSVGPGGRGGVHVFFFREWFEGRVSQLQRNAVRVLGRAFDCCIAKLFVAIFRASMNCALRLFGRGGVP